MAYAGALIAVAHTTSYSGVQLIYVRSKPVMTPTRHRTPAAKLSCPFPPPPCRLVPCPYSTMGAGEAGEVSWAGRLPPVHPVASVSGSSKSSNADRTIWYILNIFDVLFEV
jgi:hypothetical protein